jgi:hypothetical protein
MGDLEKWRGSMKIETEDDRVSALEAEIERLQHPWRAVDDQDWNYVLAALNDSGRGRFWKAVLRQMRTALSGGQEAAHSSGMGAAE